MVTGDDGYDFDWWELWPLSERTRRCDSNEVSALAFLAHSYCQACRLDALIDHPDCARQAARG